MKPNLVKLEKKLGIKWCEYKISDLFEIGTGSLVDIKSATTGKIPRISVQTTDNGVIGYYKESIENARYFENFISVNFFGVSFYHHYRASVEMKVHTLKLKGREFTKSEGLFISTVLNRRFNELYSYGNQLSSSKLKNDEIKIQLPSVMKNGKPEIAFDFMEKFISILNTEHIDTLKANRTTRLKSYLKATGFDDSTLTHIEQVALANLNTVVWGVFKIPTILAWQEKISELNPLHLDSLSISK